MHRTSLAALLLACLGTALATLAPTPAAAQQVITLCVLNNAGFVMSTRFEYTDWQGTRHESAWQRNAIGERNCVRLQDSRGIRVRVNIVVFNGDNFACVEQIDPPRTVTIQVTGTIWNPRCTILG